MLLGYFYVDNFSDGFRLQAEVSPEKDCLLPNWICLDLYEPYFLILLVTCQDYSIIPFDSKGFSNNYLTTFFPNKTQTI